jgi:acyl-CoA thioester hydrolase
LIVNQKIFKHGVRVPYAHVDQMGFVYYANYFVYFEMARTEMLREAGLPYTEMENRGVILPVVEAHCRYKKPAHYDDWLVVHSRVPGTEGTKLRIEYEILRDDDLIATGHTLHVCMSPAGKVLRPAAELTRLMGDPTAGPT